MLRYQSEQMLAMWDVCKDADHLLLSKEWWNHEGGGRDGFNAWLGELCRQLKLKNPSHLLTHGAKVDQSENGALFKTTVNDWATGDFFYSANNVESLDVCSASRYDDQDSAVINYCTSGDCPARYFALYKTWANSLGKPILINEYGDSLKHYNSQIKEILTKYNINAGMARFPEGNLNAYQPDNISTNWPVSSTINIPDKPGGEVTPPTDETLVHIKNGILYDGTGAVLQCRFVNESWQLCAMLEARGGTANVSGTGAVEYSGNIDTSSEYEMCIFMP